MKKVVFPYILVVAVLALIAWAGLYPIVSAGLAFERMNRILFWFAFPPLCLVSIVAYLINQTGMNALGAEGTRLVLCLSCCFAYYAILLAPLIISLRRATASSWSWPAFRGTTYGQIALLIFHVALAAIFYIHAYGLW